MSDDKIVEGEKKNRSESGTWRNFERSVVQLSLLLLLRELFSNTPFTVCSQLIDELEMSDTDQLIEVTKCIFVMLYDI